VALQHQDALLSLTNLQRLSLARTNSTDACAVPIGTLTLLHSLDLTAAQRLTDAALCHILDVIDIVFTIFCVLYVFPYNSFVALYIVTSFEFASM
jgi:hypothetical protein